MVKANEILASMLLTAHNLTYYQDLMAGMRAAVAEGRATRYARDVQAVYQRENKDAEDGMESANRD